MAPRPTSLKVTVGSASVEEMKERALVLIVGAAVELATALLGTATQVICWVSSVTPRFELFARPKSSKIVLTMVMAWLCAVHRQRIAVRRRPFCFITLCGF